MNDDIPYIDGVYAKYRRMWKENRWKFSSELVNLTIKKNKHGKLSTDEQHIYDTMHRVVNENGGNWLEGYE